MPQEEVDKLQHHIDVLVDIVRHEKVEKEERHPLILIEGVPLLAFQKPHWHEISMESGTNDRT